MTDRLHSVSHLAIGRGCSCEAVLLLPRRCWLPSPALPLPACLQAGWWQPAAAAPRPPHCRPGRCARSLAGLRCTRQPCRPGCIAALSHLPACLQRSRGL